MIDTLQYTLMFSFFLINTTQNRTTDNSIFKQIKSGHFHQNNPAICLAIFSIRSAINAWAIAF